MYNYKEEMKKDVVQYINDNDSWHNWSSMSREEAEDDMYEVMFTADEVTGNGSGSYTFDEHEAFMNLENNLDLLSDANREFKNVENVLKEGAESCDVTIRCYLLREVIEEVLDEYWKNLPTE